MRGGENRSTIWLRPGSIERDVCTVGGGITVSDGAAQLACSSSRQISMLGVQGQRMSWM